MAESHGIRATARFVSVSPQKARLVLDLVRGRSAVEALDLLKFTPKAAARQVAKLLRSAIANAEENYGFSRDELIVSEVFADKGPTRRWRRFGARGRFKPILHRSSHITLILREREASAGA
jgi:large subunit ribosomal protein L22